MSYYYRTIRLLWHAGYYDGPITGACEVGGKPKWFEMVGSKAGDSDDMEPEGEVYFNLYCKETNDMDIDRMRYYYIYDIPEEVMNEVIAQHEVFKEFVGTHCDYDENNQRGIGCTKPQESWKQYYEGKRKDIDIKSHLVRKNRIGWFDSNSIWYYKKENI